MTARWTQGDGSPSQPPSGPAPCSPCYEYGKVALLPLASAGGVALGTA